MKKILSQNSFHNKHNFAVKNSCIKQFATLDKYYQAHDCQPEENPDHPNYISKIVCFSEGSIKMLFSANYIKKNIYCQHSKQGAVQKEYHPVGKKGGEGGAIGGRDHQNHNSPQFRFPSSWNSPNLLSSN